MKYFSKECRYSLECKVWGMFSIFLFLLVISVTHHEMNKEGNCIEYAKFIELDYKYDSTYGCYVKRNNIWISKSESQFR